MIIKLECSFPVEKSSTGHCTGETRPKHAAPQREAGTEWLCTKRHFALCSEKCCHVPLLSCKCLLVSSLDTAQGHFEKKTHASLAAW